MKRNGQEAAAGATAAAAAAAGACWSLRPTQAAVAPCPILCPELPPVQLTAHPRGKQTSSAGLGQSRHSHWRCDHGDQSLEDRSHFRYCSDLGRARVPGQKLHQRLAVVDSEQAAGKERCVLSATTRNIAGCSAKCPQNDQWKHVGRIGFNYQAAVAEDKTAGS